jgi:small nuclear ribonucleoprotein (snRNP)-like protein
MGVSYHKENKPKDFGDFDSLIVGKEVIIKLGNGEVAKGIVSAVSKYWYLVSDDGQVTIINKAFVVSITPIQNQNLGRGGAGQKITGGGGNGGQRGK